MNYQNNVFEQRARVDISKLKEKYVIDVIAAARLQEILIYLYLSQGSRNQRGVELQTKKLKAVLHNCPRIVAPVIAQEATAAATAPARFRV